MTTMTFQPAPAGDSPAQRSDRSAGIADAYDEYETGTPTAVLTTRLDWLQEQFHSTAYVLGYAAAIACIRMQETTDAEVDTDQAFHAQARKNSRRR